jgi:S-adenosylmethionine-diacylgycerolhomoserine-N-methlytransferase
MNPPPAATDTAALPVEGYYRWQSLIYDATRWTFLFGRTALLQKLSGQTRPQRILEIGCGTGRNLAELARRFPEAELTGLDVSADMLALTEKKLAPFGQRVRLLRQRYEVPVQPGGFDLVLCSYALTMFNPGWQEALRCAAQDLAPGGLFALVDFHQSQHRWFRRWMGVNHVRLDGHLQPELQRLFPPTAHQVHRAYGGLWEYVIHIGHGQS